MRSTQKWAFIQIFFFWFCFVIFFPRFNPLFHFFFINCELVVALANKHDTSLYTLHYAAEYKKKKKGKTHTHKIDVRLHKRSVVFHVTGSGCVWPWLLTHFQIKFRQHEKNFTKKRRHPGPIHKDSLTCIRK